MAKEEPPKITFTKVKADKLRKAYAKAVKEGRAQFKFEGHELLVSYAKYLIEYLTSVGL